MVTKIIIFALLCTSIALVITKDPEEITNTEYSNTTLILDSLADYFTKVKTLETVQKIDDVKCETVDYEIKKRVCVIGAGPSGLTTARHLSESLDRFEIVVFEQNSDVGGLWLYTEETGTNKYGYPVHSSMYRDLKTNSPKEYMRFPDYLELDAPDQSLLPHAVVLDYLRNYTNHFDLRRFIQFNTTVLNVKLNDSESSVDKWKVQVKNLEANKTEEIICDYVVVCNGHVSAPNIPKIPGIENFKGLNIHSHSYRKPETFAEKKVVLLGAGASGEDIATQLIKTADKVYLSQRGPPKNTTTFNGLPKVMDEKIMKVRGIERFENGKFVLQDNSTLEVDAIIFCTGYNTEFPFLDKSAGITVDNNYVSPLYKHIVNVMHPSMNFVGLPMDPVSFPLFHVQSQYVASVLKCSARLPSKEIMMEDAKLKVENKRKAHVLEQTQRVYGDELALEGGFDKISNDYWSAGLNSDQIFELISPNLPPTYLELFQMSDELKKILLEVLLE